MRHLFVAVGATLVFEVCAHGAVVEYTNRSQWEAAAGSFTTIHFNELPTNTFVSNQYAPLGALFTDGSDVIDFDNLYPNDGAGLNAAFDETTVEFTQPMTRIACDYPGGLQFFLYYQNELVYTSNAFFGDIGSFAGLVSDVPFDEVLIKDPLGGTFVDDLHFGPPVPGPGAIVLLVGAGLCGSLGWRQRSS